MADDVLSIKETSERLMVSAETIRRWIHDGEFPNAFKKRPSGKNSPYVIPISDVLHFEAQRHKK